MNKRALAKIGWVSTTLGLTTLLSGCTELAGDEAANAPAAQGASLALTNGLAMINGLSFTNGLAATNGLALANGLALSNGLASTNGLAATNGLMTTAMGRRAVAYLASCALPAGQKLVKADQYGTNFTFPGAIGLAPGWLNAAPSAADEANVSACMLARVNSAGMHVPLWMAAATSGIGWGTSSSYPVQEAAFFGNIMRAASDGTVHAWYCDGRDYQKGIVPGRLGADESSSVYRNPWGAGELCDDHCTKYGSDGYTACNGVSNPITVWRQASYNPTFDDNFLYKLVNAKTGLVLDVANWGTSDGTAIFQWYDTGGANQRFRIIQVANSQWKIVGVHSGKAITNRNGNAADVAINGYGGGSTDNWAIDDHNGHFIIRNKSTNAYLRAPNGNPAATIGVTTSYSGADDTDWDLFAVDSL